MVTASLKKGKTIGSWTLRRYLASGGNADVWEAERGDEVVALKILRTRKTDSEPYKRFRIETDFVQRFRPDGVVPIIDSCLPDALHPDERAWIAMPVATTIRKALGDSPDVESVCSALMQIADTMSSMGIVAHRDIKPGNLYFLDGSFLVGDFGLVSYPGKEDLTSSAAELGPRNFLAPEMISNPADADGRPADVYSLAKTLWTLAAGQSAPPPGQFRRDEPLLRLGSFVDHPRIYALEELLEAATRVDPSARPNMSSFRDQLGYFLQGVPTGPSDVRDAAAKVRGAVAAVEGAIRARTDPANKLVLYELGDALAPIADALKEAGFRGFDIFDNEDILDFGGRGESLAAEGRTQAWTGGRAIEHTVKAFGNYPVFRMLSGIAIEVDRDRDVTIMVAAHASNSGASVEENGREIMGTLLWLATRRLDIFDRPTLLRALEELSFELLDNLRPALEDFADEIARWRRKFQNGA